MSQTLKNITMSGGKAKKITKSKKVMRLKKSKLRKVNSKRTKKNVRRNKKVMKGGDDGDNDDGEMFYDEINCDEKYEDKPLKRKACKAAKGIAIGTGEVANVGKTAALAAAKYGEKGMFKLFQGDAAYEERALMKDVDPLSRRQRMAVNTYYHGV